MKSQARCYLSSILLYFFFVHCSDARLTISSGTRWKNDVDSIPHLSILRHNGTYVNHLNSIEINPGDEITIELFYESTTGSSREGPSFDQLDLSYGTSSSLYLIWKGNGTSNTVTTFLDTAWFTQQGRFKNRAVTITVPEIYDFSGGSSAPKLHLIWDMDYRPNDTWGNNRYGHNFTRASIGSGGEITYFKYISLEKTEYAMAAEGGEGTLMRSNHGLVAGSWLQAPFFPDWIAPVGGTPNASGFLVAPNTGITVRSATLLVQNTQFPWVQNSVTVSQEAGISLETHMSHEVKPLLTKTTSGTTLEWNTRYGVSYSVEWSADMNSWHPLHGSERVGNGAKAVVNDEIVLPGNASQKRFYRIAGIIN